MNLITKSPSLEAGAVFSPDEAYRYLLWRQWNDFTAVEGTVLWCMLNPSTADERVLDPTLTRCQGFTSRLGYARFEVVNLFALRSTDPRELLRCQDPVGPENDAIIAKTIADAEVVVVGWGAFPLAAKRATSLLRLAGLRPLYCLGTTNGGHPKHPLYLAKETPLVRWHG